MVRLSWIIPINRRYFAKKRGFKRNKTMVNPDNIDPKSFTELTLFLTLRIELLNDKDELEGIGTGFILTVSFPQDPNQVLILLVSNRHVLGASKRFNIVFHKKIAGSNLPDLGQTLTFRAIDFSDALFFHPNPQIDLACVNISNILVDLSEKIYLKSLDRTLFANFNEPELDIGSRVVFVGYPDNRYDQKHNLPILRSGVTASHPKLNYNGEEQFLIDAQVFPGSSGSPVFLNMKEAQYNMGQIILGSGIPYLFVGVVSATMIRNNLISPLPTKYLAISQEVIGLGLVYKATALNSLVDLALDQTWRRLHPE